MNVATQSAIRRAIKAWQDCGLEVGAVEVEGATVRVLAPATKQDEPAKMGGPKQWG